MCFSQKSYPSGSWYLWLRNDKQKEKKTRRDPKDNQSMTKRKNTHAHFTLQFCFFSINDIVIHIMILLSKFFYYIYIFKSKLYYILIYNITFFVN